MIKSSLFECSCHIVWDTFSVHHLPVVYKQFAVQYRSHCVQIASVGWYVRGAGEPDINYCLGVGFRGLSAEQERERRRERVREGVWHNRYRCIQSSIYAVCEREEESV